MEFEILKNRINAYLESSLKETRLEHTRSVAKTAVKMALKYGADVRKAELAALLHDMARNIGTSATNMYIRHLKLPERYLDNVNLAHGKIAAELAKAEFGIEDEEILNAVSYHTTGRAGMTLLEKIIFLADAIEPLRNYPGVDCIRAKAETDIDAGCLEALERTVSHLEEQQIYIDKDTLDACAFLTEKLSGATGFHEENKE